MPFSNDAVSGFVRRCKRLSTWATMAFNWRFRRAWNNRTNQIYLVLLVIMFLSLVTFHRLKAVRGTETTTLCVAVLSAPTTEGAQKRIACRDSWWTLSPEHDNAVKKIFFVGQRKGQLSKKESDDESVSVRESLYEEQQLYGDLVELSVEEHYTNLTLKVIQAMKYLSSYEQCKFILKADDDTFARLDMMVAELASLKLDKWLYWGYFTGRASVYHKGRWAENNWFICDRYLPYARGGGYVFSGGLAKYIAEYADVWNRFVNEDVSFGAWTAGLNLKRVHDPRFDTEYLSRGCLNSYIVTHKQKPDEMRRKIKNLQTSGRLCDIEGETRPGYEYNWKLPPTQCCDQQYNGRRKITLD